MLQCMTKKQKGGGKGKSSVGSKEIVFAVMRVWNADSVTIRTQSYLKKKKKEGHSEV